MWSVIRHFGWIGGFTAKKRSYLFESAARLHYPTRALEKIDVNRSGKIDHRGFLNVARRGYVQPLSSP